MDEFVAQNEKIEQTLAHLIDYKTSGIESDDYHVFLKKRADRIFKELKDRLELSRPIEAHSDVHEMILNGETETVEFKSTLRFDTKKGEKSSSLEYVIIKTIAAFLNTEGGTLIIGVDDDSNILGLDADIKTLTKQDIDGFQLHLTQLFRNYIGADLISHIKVSFPEIDDKKICVIKISKSSRTVITKFEGREDYFVREGNSSRSLSREEQSRHEKQRRA